MNEKIDYLFAEFEYNLDEGMSPKTAVCNECKNYGGPIYRGFCGGGCLCVNAPITNFERGLKEPYKINHDGKCPYYLRKP